MQIKFLSKTYVHWITHGVVMQDAIFCKRSSRFQIGFVIIHKQCERMNERASQPEILTKNKMHIWNRRYILSEHSIRFDGGEWMSAPSHIWRTRYTHESWDEVCVFCSIRSLLMNCMQTVTTQWLRLPLKQHTAFAFSREKAKEKERASVVWMWCSCLYARPYLPFNLSCG